MVGVGLISLLVGAIDHRRNMQSLIAEYPGVRSSGAYLIAALISILGVLALVAVLLRQ